MNLDTEQYWTNKWYNAREARNFLAFVNRRFGGTAYRRGTEVFIRPGKASVTRGLMAASGWLGQMSLSDIQGELK